MAAPPSRTEVEAPLRKQHEILYVLDLIPGRNRDSLFECVGGRSRNCLAQETWPLRRCFMSATGSAFYYVGFDVHRKTISYCVKTSDGRIVREASIPSNRETLSRWAQSLDQPWCGGLEATICSHWIYQHLKPYALELKMAAPVRLKAITAGKRKTDCIDARMLADLLRCNLFPEC